MNAPPPRRTERLAPHDRRTRQLNVALLIVLLGVILAVLYHGKLGSLTRYLHELNPAPASQAYILHLTAEQTTLDFTGLRRRSPVTLHGLKVGMVERVDFDLDSETQTLSVTVIAHLDRFGPDKKIILAPTATLHNANLSPDLAGASIAIALDPSGSTPLQWGKGHPHRLTLISAKGGKDDPIQPFRDAAQRIAAAVESTATEYRALATLLQSPPPDVGTPESLLLQTVDDFRAAAAQWRTTALTLQSTAEQWRETGDEMKAQFNPEWEQSTLHRFNDFFTRTERFLHLTRLQMERMETRLGPTLNETRLFLNESTDLINRIGDTFFARFLVRPKERRLAPLSPPPRPVRKARPVAPTRPTEAVH